MAIGFAWLSPWRAGSWFYDPSSDLGRVGHVGVSRVSVAGARATQWQEDLERAGQFTVAASKLNSTREGTWRLVLSSPGREKDVLPVTVALFDIDGSIIERVTEVVCSKQ